MRPAGVRRCPTEAVTLKNKSNVVEHPEGTTHRLSEGEEGESINETTDPFNKLKSVEFLRIEQYLRSTYVDVCVYLSIASLY